MLSFLFLFFVLKYSDSGSGGKIMLNKRTIYTSTYFLTCVVHQFNSIVFAIQCYMLAYPSAPAAATTVTVTTPAAQAAGVCAAG